MDGWMDGLAVRWVGDVMRRAQVDGASGLEGRAGRSGRCKASTLQWATVGYSGQQGERRGRWATQRWEKSHPGRPKTGPRPPLAKVPQGGGVSPITTNRKSGFYRL